MSNIHLSFRDFNDDFIRFIYQKITSKYENNIYCCLDTISKYFKLNTNQDFITLNKNIILSKHYSNDNEEMEIIEVGFRDLNYDILNYLAKNLLTISKNERFENERLLEEKYNIELNKNFLKLYLGKNPKISLMNKVKPLKIITDDSVTQIKKCNEKFYDLYYPFNNGFLLKCLENDEKKDFNELMDNVPKICGGWFKKANELININFDCWLFTKESEEYLKSISKEGTELLKSINNSTFSFDKASYTIIENSLLLKHPDSKNLYKNFPVIQVDNFYGWYNNELNAWNFPKDSEIKIKSKISN